MIDLSKAYLENQEDLDSVSNWCADYYQENFAQYFVKQRKLYDRMKSERRPISDEELEVILTEIYPARELPIEGVTSRLIYDRLAPNVEKQLVKKDDVLSLIKSRSFDVLIVLGAGDLDNQVPQMTKMLLSSEN